MELQRDGCTIIPGVISPLECESLRQEIVTAMDRQVAGPIETTGGRIVGGRNLLDCWAGWRRVLQPTFRREVDCRSSVTGGWCGTNLVL